MDELIERLGFWIDKSGPTAVLREVGGGCHPATRSELALWDALEAAREDAERQRDVWAQRCADLTEHVARLEAAERVVEAVKEHDRQWRTTYPTVGCRERRMAARAELDAALAAYDAMKDAIDQARGKGEP